MLTHLIAIFRAHILPELAISGPLAGIIIKHYWPQLSALLMGAGGDAILMSALVRFKALLKQTGASDEEIKTIEGMVAQIALRFAQDAQKDAQAK